MPDLSLSPLSAPIAVAAGSATLIAEAAGTGPTVVCQHAGVADRRSWRPIAPALRGDHRLVAWDRRGFGDTRVATPEAYDGVADLIAVLDTLEVDRTVLVGNSMGGMLSVDAALALPDRVVGLMLVGSAPSGAPWPDDPPEATALAAAIGAAEDRGDMDALNEAEARYWLDGVYGDAGRVAGPARELFLDMNGRALRAGDVGEQAERAPAWPRLDALDVPVTWVEGTLDEPGARTLAEQARELVADLRLEVVEGVAHLPTLERPDVIADLVRDLVRRAG